MLKVLDKMVGKFKAKYLSTEDLEFNYCLFYSNKHKFSLSTLSNNCSTLFVSNVSDEDIYHKFILPVFYYSGFHLIISDQHLPYSKKINDNFFIVDIEKINIDEDIASKYYDIVQDFLFNTDDFLLNEQNKSCTTYVLENDKAFVPIDTARFYNYDSNKFGYPSSVRYENCGFYYVFLNNNLAMLLLYDGNGIVTPKEMLKVKHIKNPVQVIYKAVPLRTKRAEILYRYTAKRTYNELKLVRYKNE